MTSYLIVYFTIINSSQKLKLNLLKDPETILSHCSNIKNKPLIVNNMIIQAFNNFFFIVPPIPI